MKVKGVFVKCKKYSELIRGYLIDYYQNKIVVAIFNADTYWVEQNLYPPLCDKYGCLDDPFTFVKFENIEDAIEFYNSVPVSATYICMWENDKIINDR